MEFRVKGSAHAAQGEVYREMESNRFVACPTEVGSSRFAFGRSRPLAGVVSAPAQFANLAVVLEGLWAFYEAMHRGKAVANWDSRLADLSAALKEAKSPATVSRERLSRARE